MWWKSLVDRKHVTKIVLIKFMTEPNDDLGTKRNIGSIWEEHLGIYFSTRV